MEQLVSVWKALEPRRQVIVVLATLAMFAAVLGLARVASNPAYALLTVRVAAAAGADCVVLCDTNGGTLPWEVGDIVARIQPTSARDATVSKGDEPTRTAPSGMRATSTFDEKNGSCVTTKVSFAIRRAVSSSSMRMISSRDARGPETTPGEGGRGRSVLDADAADDEGPTAGARHPTQSQAAEHAHINANNRK